MFHYYQGKGYAKSDHSTVQKGVSQLWYSVQSWMHVTELHHQAEHIECFCKLVRWVPAADHDTFL